jgi:sialic acid synthase SpsE
MIIAEMCQNHNGNIEILRDMVFRAADAGAWACKIQTFFADDLADGWRHDYDRMKCLELNWDAHVKFAGWCYEAGVEPMTSVYTVDYANDLKAIGFKWVKIGSAQAGNSELIRVYKALGFKVIISTGGRDLNDIRKIWPLEGVLHCVSKYPHTPEESDMQRMIQVKSLWHRSPCGFSDHSDPLAQNWYMPSFMAMALGATYIERHFTILERRETKDGPVSIDDKQLKILSKFEKLTQEEKDEQLKRMDSYSIFKRDKRETGKDVIKKYEKRWVQEI